MLSGVCIASTASKQTVLIQGLKAQESQKILEMTGNRDLTQRTALFCLALLLWNTSWEVVGPLDSIHISYWHPVVPHYLHSQHVDISIGCWTAKHGTVNLQFTFPDLLLQLGYVLSLSVKKKPKQNTIDNTLFSNIHSVFNGREKYKKKTHQCHRDSNAPYSDKQNRKTTLHLRASLHRNNLKDTHFIFFCNSY